MKTKKIITILIILVIASVLLWHTKPVRTFLWKNVSTTQDMFESCFVYAPVKCGYVKYSDEQLLKKIKFLKLNKSEIRDLILNAKQEDVEKMNELNQKRMLTEEEKHIIDSIEKSKEYYDRVLQIIDKME